MEQMLCEAAITGNVNSLLGILQQDALILHRVSANCLNSSPLHLAASRGNAEFVRLLLQTNSELAGALDSRQRSPLHLAAANGFLDTVRELVNVSPEMCRSRDRDGANPLHLAAMKGKVEVLDELVWKCPHAALARLDGGATVLHLCVMHDQLNALALLLHRITCLQLVNAKDDNGNTILHLAVMYKRFEIVRHMVKESKIDVNATNSSGHTAMDILSLAKSSDRGPDKLILDMEEFLTESKAKKGKSLAQEDWVTKKRDALMVVASLIATMAFQAGVNPPGAVWQEDNDKHRAGEAVMAYNYPDSYHYFLRSNTIGFVASLSTILLLISGFPFRRRAFMWILVVIMWLAISATAFSYAFANVVITPKKDRGSLSDTILVAVIVWCSVMGLLLLVHTGRLIATIIQEKHNIRSNAFDRIFRFRLGRKNQTPTDPNLGYGNQSVMFKLPAED
ncbi:ankyrin repeat-containing protein BDA1-like [Diospyros lotus]|uniref:ankyrin repeat-containing protein BDA1-like n=1 Tax=Diospyros lotus TaxID=55363 RepID=UPI002254CEAF|nr:ankyrin repeat-containing protein BDA1-like [Diospyros lotus]